MSLYKKGFSLSLLVFLSVLSISVADAYGHGLGLDSTLIDVLGKKILVTTELPLNFEPGKKWIRVNVVDEKIGINVENVTLRIRLSHNDKMIFDDYFFTQNGILVINIVPTNENKISIFGQRDPLLEAWYATELHPLEVRGEIFEKGGLYHFEMELKTIDESTNIIDDLGVFTTDVTIIDTFYSKNNTEFSVKSYFDTVSYLSFDPINNILAFEMPFDWSTKNISHIPVVHEELHFPKNFSQFLSPSYVGEVNGVDLFKSSITIDDYSNENERIVHFVLLQDHLKILKNKQEDYGELPDYIRFALKSSEKTEFPMVAFTKNEEFQVDLSWEPLKIEPENNVKFIFTIRNGKTGEPVRQSSYDFLIIQNGEQIHKKSGVATIGGGFESFTFSEKQTGPTVIRFDDIRNTGSSTEFGIVVIPEFGSISILILVSSMLLFMIFDRRLLSKIHFR